MKGIVLAVTGVMGSGSSMAESRTRIQISEHSLLPPLHPPPLLLFPPQAHPLPHLRPSPTNPQLNKLYPPPTPNLTMGATQAPSPAESSEVSPYYPSYLPQYGSSGDEHAETGSSWSSSRQSRGINHFPWPQQQPPSLAIAQSQ